MPDLFDDVPPKPGDGYSAKDIEVLEGLEPVRRRPGMYVGGTDERALHHLAAEALDNAMDEAVAGHATRIELELGREGWVTVRDNGRGIPVDKHPRFPDKSALEVILTTLHSGGKFGGDAYKTSGGLHGVGVSVVNALSDALDVEVARDRRLWRQHYVRGQPQTALEDAGPVQNRRGTTLRFHPDPEIFGDAEFRPATLYRMARSKAYLFRGVEIRWSCDPSLQLPDGVPQEARLHFPGGLGDFLNASLADRPLLTPRPFLGKVDFPDGGSVEWAVAWPEDEDDGFAHSYCNTIPTIEGGTHEAGLRNVLTRGLKAHGELIGNKRVAQAIGEDVTAGAAMLLSLFLRDPQFQGQTKERLASAEATRLVENAVRDHFDHWLGADPATTRLLLDRIAERADERQKRRQQKELARKTPTRKLRLPGKLSDCTRDSAAGTESFLVEGDSAGGSAKHARNPGALRHHPRARRCSGQPLQGRGAALRAGHHHDRRRCRRRAHRLAVDDVLLPRDAQAGRQRPPLSGAAAALPADPGQRDAIRPRRRASRGSDANRLQRARQGRGEPVQGAGRDAGEVSVGDDDGPGAAHRAARQAALGRRRRRDHRDRRRSV